MKKLITMMVFLILGITAFARTHIVQRGENLQSIAAKYNVTVPQLVEANPGADKLFYVGLKLNIPETATSTENQDDSNSPEPQTDTAETPAEEYSAKTSKSLSASDFAHVYINYMADPDAFDKGFYGIGTCSYNYSGFGASISVHGNWGIVDKGQFASKFGPAYGYPINQYVLVNTALRGFIYTYDKPNGKTATSTDQKVNGGITLTPGLTFKLDKFFIDAGFEFGWCNGSSKLYKCIELGIGYSI